MSNICCSSYPSAMQCSLQVCLSDLARIHDIRAERTLDRALLLRLERFDLRFEFRVRHHVLDLQWYPIEGVVGVGQQV
jgi:hypothetical protein